MYINGQNLGEEIQTVEVDVEKLPEVSVAIAEDTSSVDPERKAYGIQLRDEINKERIKTGLTPLLLPGQQPPAPKKDNFAIGVIALLVIVYLLLSKS
jgi:hypothetical protein